ncbi:hypothetical protein CBL_03992 [Carabus blaptoides fortunei]
MQRRTNQLEIVQRRPRRLFNMLSDAFVCNRCKSRHYGSPRVHTNDQREQIKSDINPVGVRSEGKIFTLQYNVALDEIGTYITKEQTEKVPGLYASLQRRHAADVCGAHVPWGGIQGVSVLVGIYCHLPTYANTSGMTSIETSARHGSLTQMGCAGVEMSLR